MVLERSADELREARISGFRALLKQRILILDCAMGTMIQDHGLGEEDYRGVRFADHPHDLKGNNDLLCLTRPDVIQGIHEAVLEVGADIVETNTFNANAISQRDYGTEELAYEINREAARLAREAADGFSERTPDKPRFVAGGVGAAHPPRPLFPSGEKPRFRDVNF